MLFGLGGPCLQAEPVEDMLQRLVWPERPETAMLAFSEERTFPFRRFPKRYTGKMYRSPEGDLAIVYDSPRSMRLLIRGDSIQLDDGSGSLQTIPSDRFDGHAISDLLRGDVQQLKTNWNIEPTADGLKLSPKSESIAANIDFIEVYFASQSVQSVRVHQSNQATRNYEFGEVVWISGDDAATQFAN